MLSKKLWMAAAVIPLVAAGQWAGTTASAQPKASLRPVPLTSSRAATLSHNVTKRVIVVFKNQATKDPASRSLVKARLRIESQVQRPVLSELHATKARSVHSYTSINALAAIVSPGEEARLKANPAVAEVVPDQIIHLASPFDAAQDDCRPAHDAWSYSSSRHLPRRGCPAFVGAPGSPSDPRGFE